jgi:hypothetical protein
MRKLIAGGLLAVLSALVFAEMAFGASHHPRGEFAQFNECPIGPDEIDDCVLCMQPSFRGVNEIHESINKPIKQGTAELAPLTWLLVLGTNCYVGSNPNPIKQKVICETGCWAASASAPALNSKSSAGRGAERNAQPDQFFDAAQQLNRSLIEGACR